MRISIGTNKEISNYQNMSIDDFIEKVESSEATHIYAPTILNKIRFEKHPEFINILHSKLRLGGELQIGGLDGFEVSREVLVQTIKLSELSKMIIDEHIVSFPSTADIKELLVNSGFKISTCKLNGPFFLWNATK